jgi:hypothetical protein
MNEQFRERGDLRVHDEAIAVNRSAGHVDAIPAGVRNLDVNRSGFGRKPDRLQGHALPLNQTSADRFHRKGEGEAREGSSWRQLEGVLLSFRPVFRPDLGHGMA